MNAIDKVRVTPRNVYTFTTPEGVDIDTAYAGEIPEDRTDAIRLMTRYVMAAKDPDTMYDRFLVAVPESERAREETLELFRKAEDSHYVGPHTEARNDAVNWLLRMQPELFELEDIEQPDTQITTEGIIIPFQDRQPSNYTIDTALVAKESA